ncbi:Rsp5p-dependent ubiquitination, sorting of cargo proteins at the multivesicular body [Allomyces javanicus]|nr:Rsp5p-dependent ubiquitination, sorting of cargo proteins at the multivesicular body [Allomyces javanicus]
MQSTARSVDSWDADAYGPFSSLTHPLIGPAGAPGFWNRASIAASESTAPGALRNCTFVTLSSSAATTTTTTMYFGSTCPRTPRPSAVTALLLSLLLGLLIAWLVVKTNMGVTMRDWAQRVWVTGSTGSNRVRGPQARARQEPVARARAQQQQEEEVSTLMLAALQADKSSATHVVVDGCATVHVEEDRSAPWTTRIEFRSAAPRSRVSDRGSMRDVVAFTNLPIPANCAQRAPARHRPIYFEVTVLAIPPSSTIAIGLVRQPLRPVRMPGWHRGSIGYDAVTGCVRYCPSHPPAVVGPATTRRVDAYGVGDVVGVAIWGGKVTYTRNDEIVAVVDGFAEQDVHVAVGATGKCAVEVQWDAPWRWDEANERRYTFYVVGGDAGGQEESASLARPVNDDAPPPYSRRAGSSSGMVRRKSI